MSAVKGSALLAAALAAGGRAGVDGPDGGGAMGRFAEDQRWAHPHRTFPSVDDDHAAESGTGAWSVGAIAGALRHVLDEDGGDAWLEDEEGTGAGAFEDEEDGGGEGGLLAGLATDARGRSLAPRLGPEALAGSGRRGKPRGGGWDARNVALLAAELHGNFAWDVEPGPRGSPPRFSAGRAPTPTPRLPRRRRSGRRTWDGARQRRQRLSRRCASRPPRGRRRTRGRTRTRCGGTRTVWWRRCARRSWANTDGECRMFWKFWTSSRFGTCRDACGLVTGLSDWDDDALASLLDGLITWRGRDREEVATVAATLRAARGWTGWRRAGESVGSRGGRRG